MSVALAHEYFSAHGGAERVVEVFHRMYPDAPVYTFFHDRRAYGPLPGYDLRTSFLQSVPHGGGAHRALLRNMDKLLTQVTGVACYAADNPLYCVAKGTGLALEHFDFFKKSLVPVH